MVTLNSMNTRTLDTQMALTASKRANELHQNRVENRSLGLPGVQYISYATSADKFVSESSTFFSKDK